MRTGKQKLSPEAIEEMLSIYAKGSHSSVEIGRIYNIDHSTVIHHAKKHGVVPVKPMRIDKTLPQMMIKERWIPKKKKKIVDKYAHIFDQQEYSSTRSYASYLKEALERPIEKHYMDLYRLV